MLSRVRLTCLFALAFALTGSSAKAEIVVDILDLSMLSGSRASLDVMVSSNAADLNITSFELRFGISERTTGGILQFQADFDDASATFKQSDSERSDSNYVLADNIDPPFFQSRRAGSNLELIQRDATATTATPATIGSGMSLLARLEIEHISPELTDGEFEVFLIEGANTLFLNGFDIVNIDSSSYATRASNQANGTNFNNFGIVTVQAVPEPSSVMLLGGALASCCLVRRRRA